MSFKKIIVDNFLNGVVLPLEKKDKNNFFISLDISKKKQLILIVKCAIV